LSTQIQFSENFTIVLFHYDGVTSAWNDEFEWSRNAIHISVKKQTKWYQYLCFNHFFLSGFLTLSYCEHKVVCKEILAPGHCSTIRLYIHMGWGSWSWSL